MDRSSPTKGRRFGQDHREEIDYEKLSTLVHRDHPETQQSHDYFMKNIFAAINPSSAPRIRVSPSKNPSATTHLVPQRHDEPTHLTLPDVSVHSSRSARSTRASTSHAPTTRLPSPSKPNRSKSSPQPCSKEGGMETTQLFGLAFIYVPFIHNA